MTSTSTIGDRQQLPSEPSQGGVDDGQPVTVATILQRVQSRQEAVGNARDGDAAGAIPSPAPAVAAD